MSREASVKIGPYHVRMGDERILPATGLALVGQLLGKSALTAEADCLKLKENPEPSIPNRDVILSYIGVLAQGHTEFDAVKLLKEDEEASALNLGLCTGVPSEATLRQRMDQTGDRLRGAILRTNTSLIQGNKIKPSANEQGYVPVDVDVTPFDNSGSHKEGVSRTYKGNDGYAPIIAYAGTEGYMVNCELREGRQHCQKETPDFLWETLHQAQEIAGEGAKLLVRMDSGNDAAENIGVCIDMEASYLIKRNLRGEKPEEWEFNAQANGLFGIEGASESHPREGKTVYTGSMPRDIQIKHADGQVTPHKMRIVYEVTERTIKSNGQILLAPEIQADTWWTNLSLPEEEIIDLYHAHAECEQYHSELKTDMGVERLPSGKFATNALVLELAMLVFNLLRLIGQESLKADDTPLKRSVKRRRLSTVIKHLILLAAHFTKHARQKWLSLGRSNPWAKAFIRIGTSFG